MFSRVWVFRRDMVSSDLGWLDYLMGREHGWSLASPFLW
jgi:hypothetical protein